MENNRKPGILDFYLPKPWNLHARMLFFAIVFPFIQSAIFKMEMTHTWYAVIFFIILIDVELLFWISKLIFKSIKFDPNPNKYTFVVVVRIVIFYISMLFFGALVFISVLTVSNLLHGNELIPVLEGIIKNELSGMFWGLNLGAIFATFLFFIIMWQEALRANYKMRDQVLLYQNETLKNQVNPHFLFNSLNTLSALIKTDANQAEEFTQKLSVMYRYILENREVDVVPLSKELAFINDYFYLQQIRNNEGLEMILNIENDTCEILPISLQILVENAIKHNVATKEIPLKIEINQIGSIIEVKNNLQPKNIIEKSTGTGLNNLSERVKIVTGKEIKIDRLEKEFIVTIPIICV